jgi:hypothetical protein
MQFHVTSELVGIEGAWVQSKWDVLCAEDDADDGLRLTQGTTPSLNGYLR